MRMSMTSLVVALSLLGLSTSASGAALDGVDADWARAAVAGAETLTQTQPELARSIATGQPRLSRSGQPLFVDLSWRVPEASGALLVRIAEGADSPAERVGLLDALSRTDGDWAEAVVALIADESSTEVRRMMVEILREAPVDTARSGVQLGLTDPSDAVRAAAVRVVGNHAEGSQLGELAVAALADSSVQVREEAARSIGYAGYTAGFASLRDLLQDADADVRFRALRSLEKLDESKVRALPELAPLAADTDARIAREASKLLAR